MKKLFAIIFALMLITTAASAEPVTIDVASASDDELSSIVQIIRNEQVNRYKERLANQHIEADSDGITFRSIPWFSTVDTAENIIGQISQYKSAGDLHRLSYIDYSNVSTGADSIEGELGCNIGYSGLAVAGYKPTSTRICYMFPVVDGQIVRDISLAQIYMAYYTFDDDDYGDLSVVYDDLNAKLNKLYGQGNESVSKYFTNMQWRDNNSNVIRLQRNDTATYLTLAYVAASADDRIDDMVVAYTDEKTKAEDAIRYENVNNTDGL